MPEINEILKNIIWETLEEEGITKDSVAMVDLNIEFSPVIPYKGADPCEVTETMGDKYIVHGIIDGNSKTVDAETLKVMRYRYLMNRPQPNFFEKIR